MVSLVMGYRSSTSTAASRCSFIRQHTYRKQGELYGDWIFRLQWTQNKGSILNTIPLVKRCSCPCQVKIVQTATQIIMSGGQGQVPHSSAKVVGCNLGQACSDEQRIAASDARPRLTYQQN